LLSKEARSLVVFRKLSCATRNANSRDEIFDSSNLSPLIDTLPFRAHNYVYVTPVEVGQARPVKRYGESRPT